MNTADERKRWIRKVVKHLMTTQYSDLPRWVDVDAFKDSLKESVGDILNDELRHRNGKLDTCTHVNVSQVVLGVINQVTAPCASEPDYEAYEELDYAYPSGKCMRVREV